VRALIVDDSALMRQLLTGLLEADPEITVVGTAADPYIARDRIKALNPDVITLDVEMPHMDGLTFLRKIMALRPMPVVMVSTLTQSGAETTLEALEVGAVDFIAKPAQERAERLTELADELQQKVKAAAQVRVAVRQAARPAPRAPRRLVRSNGRIVFVGASTGGIEALKSLLMGLPEDCPPTLITQHMPPRFTTGFAERLNRECPMKVSEAADGDVIEAGRVYIAPGSHHLEIVRRQWVPVPALGWSAGQRPSAFGRCVVPFGGPGMRQDGRGRDPDRHGQGRRRGFARIAPRRRRDARPGRGIVADLRHAARRIRARRGHAAIFPVAHGRRHSRRMRAWR
jgi:chemotaxis response regulator CheB